MVIPADWKEVRLGDIALVVMGQSPQSIYYNTREDGIPLIQGNADIIDRKSIQRIWTSVSPKVAEPGDVLITVRAPVGYAAIASEQVCLGRGVCAIQPHAADSRFVFHSLVYWEPKWKKLEQGSTFTAANSKEVNDFTIHVPDSTKEQEAIAEALSDADAAIESLDALIAKKRDVKQATMQQLLTGRSRLPGFNADWKEVRLGEICEIYQPTTIGGKDFKESGEFVVYGANGPIGRYNRYNHEDPEVTVTCRGATCGTVNVTPPRVWITGNAMVVRPKAQTLSKLMLKYILQALDYSDVITGAAQPQITGAGLSPCQILVPPLKEQEAIAEALTVMDDELEALTEQVSKLRMVKEGMMQDLLTGKVRLV